MRGWTAGLLVLLAACGGCEARKASKPYYGPLEIVATPLPLDPRDPAQTRVGQLTYAGGVQIAATNSDRLHGLSGIDVTADGQAFIAVTDYGDLVRGRLRLGPDGRLMGVADLTLEPLRDEAGKALGRKKKGDAEDVSFLDPAPAAGSAYAVSFEHDHRVLSYAGPGAPAKVLFKPGKMRIRPNRGMEGLAARCSGAPEKASLWVGFEDGDISNRLAATTKGRGSRDAHQPAGFALSSLANRDCETLFVLYRAYDPINGFRAVIGQAGQAESSWELARLSTPLTRGNLEGLAAVDRSTPAARAWRLYVVTDDGFDPRGRRTLLMAFDWTPAVQQKRPASPPAVAQSR